VYNDASGKSTCQVVISEDLEQCGYELAGKFPTNLKHLKKHHLLQYQAVVWKKWKRKS